MSRTESTQTKTRINQLFKILLSLSLSVLKCMCFYKNLEVNVMVVYGLFNETEGDAMHSNKLKLNRSYHKKDQLGVPPQQKFSGGATGYICRLMPQNMRTDFVHWVIRV